MLINLSNHPAEKWDETQKNAALPYGKLVDLPFPAINPEADIQFIDKLAHEYFQKIGDLQGKYLHDGKTISPPSGDSGGLFVHIMGELTFCFALVARLQKAGITCLASTTRREAVENGNGLKTSRFEFVRFREYTTLTL